MSERPTLTPHIVVSDAAAAIDFYKRAFGATEIQRHAAPNSNKVMHALLSIHGSNLMLHDDFSPEMGQRSETPEAMGGSPVTLHLQVENADAVWEKALASGAVPVMPLKDQFWGDRYGMVRDPFGHKWSIGQTIAKPTEEELQKGAKEAFEQAVSHVHA